MAAGLEGPWSDALPGPRPGSPARVELARQEGCNLNLAVSLRWPCYLVPRQCPSMRRSSSDAGSYGVGVGN